MINGDRKLSIIQRLFYFPQCIKNWFQNPGYRLSINSVHLKYDPIFLGSPSRILCNMFWKSIDWNYISAQLDGEINILDLACGSGRYGLKYQQYLGANFGSYTGLDIYKSSDFPDSFEHILDKAENLISHYKNQNLIVSQSALEHIEKDTQCLKDALNSQIHSSRKFMQIHLLPASISLFLYLWHGWRQYSLRNLSSISGELNSVANIQIRVFPIGGFRSFYAHFRHITLPVYFFKIFKREYHNQNIKGSNASTKIRSAVLNDRNAKGLFPIFWAFVICSKEIDCSKLFKNKEYLKNNS